MACAEGWVSILPQAFKLCFQTSSKLDFYYSVQLLFVTNRSCFFLLWPLLPKYGMTPMHLNREHYLV